MAINTYIFMHISSYNGIARKKLIYKEGPGEEGLGRSLHGVLYHFMAFTEASCPALPGPGEEALRCSCSVLCAIHRAPGEEPSWHFIPFHGIYISWHLRKPPVQPFQGLERRL